SRCSLPCCMRRVTGGSIGGRSAGFSGCFPACGATGRSPGGIAPYPTPRCSKAITSSFVTILPATRSCASARTRTRDFCEATGAFSPAPCSPHEPQYLPYTMINRVVLVTTYFRPIVGGVESNAERLAKYLSAGGFLVRVLTKRITRELPDSEEDDGVTVQRLWPFRHPS